MCIRDRSPPAESCLLLPTPSCNKISGEDLRQRGSARASFRACASSTYSTLGGTPFLVFITSERRSCFASRSSYAVEGPPSLNMQPGRQVLPLQKTPRKGSSFHR